MPQRKRIALAACGHCRGSKVKCDGVRPRCGHCQRKNIECVFTTNPGETRSGALRSENERLRGINGSLVDFIWQLKYADSRQAQLLIDNFDPVENLLQRPAVGEAAGGQSRDHRNELPMLSSLSGSSGSVPQKSVHDTITPPRASLHSDGLRLSLQHNINNIREASAIKEACISEIFYCHSQDELSSLIAAFNNDDTVSSAVMCEMYAAAATSGQYARDLLGTELLDGFYDAARLLFDESIQTSTLTAIKVAAMLGLYNLLNKSTVALAYLDLGLALCSRTLRQGRPLDTGLPPDHLRLITRIERSLIFCNGWLQATLGYVPLDIESRGLNLAESMHCPSEQDFIQDIIASVAVVKANTMRVLWDCTDVPSLLDSVPALQQRLRAWYGRLPHSAQLHQQGSGYIHLKTSIYYAHLLHMGATMLIFRRCLDITVGRSARGSLSNEHHEILDSALQDGIDAAQHTARILSLVRRASQSVRHCWITIYQAYVSGLVLAYHTAQSKLHAVPEHHWATSLGLLDDVLHVLCFCAELDPVARSFGKNLTMHKENLQKSRRSSAQRLPAAGMEQENDGTVPRTSTLLLATFPTGTLLQQTSARILEQLCDPYMGSNEDGPVDCPQTQAQASPALEAPPQARERFTADILNREDGYFIGSPEPSWWTAQRSSKVYLQGASKVTVL